MDSNVNVVSHHVTSNPPIRRLPYDLFLNILLLDKARQKRNRHWTRLLEVCRDWYREGCASPVLWRVISVSDENRSGVDDTEHRARQLAKMSLFLRRAANATLDVSLYVSGDDIEPFVTLLLPRATHIRRLHAPRIKIESFPKFQALLRCPMQRLESLDVDVRPSKGLDGRSKGSNVAHPCLLPESFQRLRHLSLCGFSYIPSLPQTTSIRSLELRNIGLNSKSSRREILDLLSACPLLETLHLVTIPTILPQSPEERTIPLHNLRVLHVSGPPSQIHWLLSSIDCRPTSMVLTASGASVQTRGWIADLLPLPLSRYPALSTVSDLCFEWHARGYVFSAPGLRLALNFEERELPHFMLDTATRDLCTLFAGAPVSSLSLVFKAGTVSLDHMQRVLRAFPAVLSLCMNRVRDRRIVLDALTADDPRVVVPRLQALSLVYCPIDEGELRSCLERRYACPGVDRLQELHITISTRGPEALLERRAKGRELLGGVAEKVEYRRFVPYPHRIL